MTCQPLLVYSQPRENTEVFESRIQKYLVEMFQDERIKKVRKTTKWAVSVNDELRRILIDCEQWSKMARHGGIQSQLIRKSSTIGVRAERVWSSITSVSGQAALVSVMSTVAILASSTLTP